MRKLKLNRQTIRTLAASDLRLRVVGGVQPTDSCKSITGQDGQCYCDSLWGCP